MMEMSTTITDLAAALSKAQGEMGGAVKDSENPFFKAKYADLSSVMDACRAPLAAHGLSVVQSPSADGNRVSVETLLLHTSGQWVKGTASASAKDDAPQSIGSAITYLRRYALQSFVGVAPEDDDGEAATARGNGHHVTAPAPSPPAILPAREERENQAAATGETRGTLPPGVLLVTKVDETTIPSGKMAGKPKWHVHFNDGNKASTIDMKAARRALQAHADRIPVRVELKKTQWGYDLITLQRGAPAEPEIQVHEDEGPVNSEEIPF